MSDIRAWLEGLGLGEYADAFHAEKVTLENLRDLTDSELRELGLPLGPRKTIMKAAKDLVAGAGSPPPPVPKAPSEAERRQLSVMFCDLVGSTALSSQLDPEDMREVIRAYQDACAGVIARFEGFVAKFMGDGVLAYFGYPRAHEDEAERAVRAGLALNGVIGKLSTPAGEPLAARIGIATGLVVVGDLVGESAAQEQAVVGDTPNLAARLQGVARPGQLVIAEATRRLLGERFDLADLGPQKLKGLAEPVAAFCVVGERTVQSRFEAHRGQLLPMVGRDQELALLLERWAQAKTDEGQGVLLVGEAGIGKSRITRSLLDALAREPHIRIRYQCSPYHTDSALWPVIQQLNHAAGIAVADTSEAKLKKLETLLDRAGRSEAAPLIASLVGLDDIKRYGDLNLTPQAQRTRTIEALVQQLLGLAAQQPVLLVLEDAHWIDPTTLELIELCLDRSTEAPVLILITSRPDSQPQLAGHPHVTRLTLNRLGRAGAEAIVARLGGDHLPDETIAAIVARTDGVPLFVEELTKAILETGETSIPSSLHDSLMARLDRIPEVKEIAQIAACIGREFAYPLLAAVTDRPEPDLQASLDKLADAELVFRRGTPPEAIYSFKHALVQDAAYESLLRRRRRELHTRIAQALEEGFPEIVEAEPEVLAQHHSTAGQTEAAFGYWVEAGRRAAQRSANREAIEHLTNARGALDDLPAGSARDRRELDLLMILGPATLAIRGFTATEVEPIYMRVRELCLELDDRDQGLATFQALRTLYMVKGRLADARAEAEELLALGACNEADSYQFEGHRALGVIELQSGFLVPGRDHLKRALTFYDPTLLGTFANLPNGHPGVIALSYLGTSLDLTGVAEQAERPRREAFELAHELAHPFSLAQALYVSTIAHVLCHRVRAAEEAANAFLAVSREQGFEGWSGAGFGTLGWARALQGHSEAGVAYTRQGLAGVERMGAVLFEGEILVKLAEALSHTGEFREGLSVLARHRRLVTATGLALYDTMARRVEGELRVKLAEPEAAEACFKDALQIARRQEARPLELQAAMALARLWRDQGKPAEAHALLAPIYGWFTEGLDSPDLVEAKELLDALQ